MCENDATRQDQWSRTDCLVVVNQSVSPGRWTVGGIPDEFEDGSRLASPEIHTLR